MQKEQQAQEQTQPQPYQQQNKYEHRIYPVTEGINSPFSQNVYQRAFNHFLNHTKIHDLQVLLDFSPKVIKQMIIDYILYLRDEKKIKRSSIKVHLAAILHFFQINNDDFTLTTKNFRIHLPSNDSIKEDRSYTREEIAQILKDGCTDLRSKVAIHLLCSTGMRMGALHRLQINHLTEKEYQGHKLYEIKVYGGTPDFYYSLCTPECYNVIQDYLEYRRRAGEEIKDKSPLIREQFNVDDRIRIQYPRFVTEKAIEYLINQVLKRSGVRKPGEVHMSHGFRKFFITQCESSPMKSLHVSMLVGHDTGIKKHYYKSKDAALLKDYMTNALDALTIDPTKRLQQENHDLKTVQAEELENVKQRMENMKDWMRHCFKQIVEWTRPLNPELAETISLNRLQLDDPEE